VKAIAQAVATSERGKEIACDAGEIVVLADTRRAELEAEERAARPKHTGKPIVSNGGVTHLPLPKSKLVQESRRAPLQELDEPSRDAYFAACRAAKVPPTTSAASVTNSYPVR
jgi:hypothetical protein